MDTSQGTTIQTPYKIDDIIFWPDDYSSKAFGAVVRTLSGYRFWNFHGWVKFPEKVYAYTYDNGRFKDLKYRSYEDAWRIDTSDEVLLYPSPPQFVSLLTLPLLGEFTLPDSPLGRVMDKLLPDEGGPVTCYRTVIGIEEAWAQPVAVAQLAVPSFDKSDYSRLNNDMHSLTDLAWVYELLNNGQCAAVSMYSGSSGESIGIVYGYTRNGDLMVADESLQPAGMIRIDERARRMMDQDGNITQVSWFEWEGFGFDSARRGDKISFFASTLSPAQEQTDESYAQEITGQSVPDQAVQDQVVSEQAVSEQALPDQSVPNQTVSEQVVPDQGVTGQAAAEQVVSGQMISDQAVPEQAVPE